METELSTVNVIVYGNPSDVTSVRLFKSFPDTPAGNDEAEKLFAEEIRKVEDTSFDAMAAIIDDGYYRRAGKEFCLVHSI